MATARMARMGAVAVLVSAWAASASATLPGGPISHLCADQTGRFERVYGIPPQLLDAISKVESGRWDDARRVTVAWPWTVTAQGNGKYFPSKAEAVAEVRRLEAAGIHNIDVGCMQVDLGYHPDAFASLDEAFDPPANVAYAARFLKGLYGATNQWSTAAAYYHSQTPSLAAAYRERLMKVWRGGGETELASLAPIPHEPPLRPRPSLSPRVEAMRAAWHARSVAMHDEARQIADAYRQARLAEYQLRRSRMMDMRRAAGLSADGY